MFVLVCVGGEILTTHDDIVEAADRLFYQQGYEKTSFTDIAEAVKISRGNFYYHFRTKDEILAAVIGLRLANTQKLLDKWQEEGVLPQDRIRNFINILIMNRVKIKQFGCPVGTLCSELAKLDHSLLGEANKLFELFRKWLRKQFQSMGFGSKKEADAHAMHVLAFSQGVATLANAFHDEKFIKKEVKQMEAWLDGLPCQSADTEK
ncbi:MAG: TetR/AcrR family transcriptional regulator [Gammaproteobacteria bacterium]|nr:TetR/AcrR family transcriptional regulator [Gammaproteobacteria bacterium]